MKINVLENLLIKQKFRIVSIEKKVLLPMAFFDKFNKFLEKTFFNNFCIFIFVKAEK